MNLFTWFFVIPGLVLIGLGALGLFADRKGGSPRPGGVTSESSAVEDADRTLVSSGR